jgi:uncharacterized protein (TIGR02466 family)
MNKQTLDLFPTLVMVYDLSFLDLNLIYKNLTKIYSGPHGLIDNSNSSYGHDFSILYQDDLVFVKEAIDNCIIDYVSTSGLQPINITGSWYSVMDIGKRLHAHRHEGSVVSGVLYVDVDDNTVPLIIKSPLMPYKMNDLYEKFDNPYASSGVSLKPVKGNLIIFPSWIEHETPPEEGTRCIISFNTFYG